MQLAIVGVSHKTAPVEIRECLAFPEATRAGALQKLKAHDGVAEAMAALTPSRIRDAQPSGATEG